MSFDLQGKIRIKDDGASRTLEKIAKQTEQACKATDNYRDANGRLRNAQGRFVSSSKQAKTAMRGFGTAALSTSGAISKVSGGMSRLVGSIGLIAAAYGAARVASSLFNKTVAAAANYEMSEITVGAMFGKANTKAAKSYFDYVEQRSSESMFDQSDFLTAGKSFIPTTKNNKQLEKMLNLAERLGAIDPEQGLTGAAYALKEMFSGDAVSLVERFELPRAAMNEIKKLPLEKQLKALDKYLDGIGATNELIGAQSSTTMGQYKKSLAQINKAFREMGTGALKSINPLLADFNKWMKGADFARFKNAGVAAMTGFFEGASKTVRKAASYLDTHFISNPKFNSIPDISGKIKFIYEDILESFNKYMESGGSAALTDVSKRAIDILAAGMKASQPLVEAAMKVGIAVGEGILKGILSVKTLDVILGKDGPTILAAKQYKTDEVRAEHDYYRVPATSTTTPYSPTSILPGGNKFPTSVLSATGFGKSGGLDNVPYNNYPARLHAGEAVLTREENKGYRESGGSGGGGQVIITGNTFHVREEADINRIAGQLARLMAT